MTSNELVAKVYISMLWRDKRKGKGFSKGELASAGMTLQDAKIQNIPVDKRRRTSHSWNIQALTPRMVVISLVEVKGIGKVTAAKLEAAGINNAKALANCNIEDLATKGFSKTSLSRWQQNAQKLLDER
jgi:hypothetical protein